MARGDPRSTAAYQRMRAEVLALSDVCWLCGEHGADTADHVTPHALGGETALHNLRPAHLRCNTQRGLRDVGPQGAHCRDW